MKSSNLLEVLHKDSNKQAEASLRAAVRANELDAQYRPNMEKILSGAALLFAPSSWDVSTSVCHFARDYHPSGIYAGVNVSLTIRDVPSWASLSPMFEVLDQLGLPVENWESKDDAASYSRIYRQELHKETLEPEGGHVEVCITANLPGDTETCKRVIVGWRGPRSVPSEPIYELQCEGGAQ